MFGKWRRQRELARTLFPEDWVAMMAAAVAQWPYLDESEREQLEDDTRYLVVGKRWEAAKDFTLTDEIRVTIAAQAALLVLGLEDHDPYRNVGVIIVHPTTVVLGGQRRGPAGTISDLPDHLLGLAQYDGPIIIAWDEAQMNARHPERGHNVVYHEFAHKLDMLDGTVDGTPPLPNQDAVRRWIEVCTPEFEAVRRGENDPILRDYAAVDPGEFFAVVTEVFFDVPVELEARKPELYGVMRDFYRQDPALRIRRSDRVS